MKRVIPTIIIDERILSRQGLASLLHGTDYKVIASISSPSALRNIHAPVERPLLAIVGVAGNPNDIPKLVREVHALIPGSKVVAIAECLVDLDLSHVQNSGLDGIVFDVGSGEALWKAFDLALLGQQLVIMKPTTKSVRDPAEDPAALSADAHSHGADGCDADNKPAGLSASIFHRPSRFFEKKCHAMMAFARRTSEKRIACSC